MEMLLCQILSLFSLLKINGILAPFGFCLSLFSPGKLDNHPEGPGPRRSGAVEIRARQPWAHLAVSTPVAALTLPLFLRRTGTAVKSGGPSV